MMGHKRLNEFIKGFMVVSKTSTEVALTVAESTIVTAAQKKYSRVSAREVQYALNQHFKKDTNGIWLKKLEGT
jgi:mannose/cellobiose epimerase-like protein (N-acyl-D-glucosamine 2-epimerase family)